MPRKNRPAAPTGTPRPNVVSIAEAGQIRATVGLARATGPSARKIQRALQTYVEQFDFWYTAQWTTILGNYVERVVRRINPYVRRAQHGDCTPEELATALVADWDSRNFVTAGGQALEAMAIDLGKDCEKAGAEGVDIERRPPRDPATVHLYVVKSGAVTRNTDIVGKMKQNLRAAARRLQQNPGVRNVVLNYATCVGTTNSTNADGVLRPSSARFWSEIMDVPEDKAMALVWAVTNAAAAVITRPEVNRRALVTQVAAYIANPRSPTRIDWEFLVKTVSKPPRSYRAEHGQRDTEARRRGEAVMAAG